VGAPGLFYCPERFVQSATPPHLVRGVRGVIEGVASSHPAGPCFVRETLRSAARYGFVEGGWHLLRVGYGEDG
jgi:hypothetical protein